MLTIDILGEEEYDPKPQVIETEEPCEVCSKNTRGCCSDVQRPSTQLQVINIDGQVVPAP